MTTAIIICNVRNQIPSIATVKLLDRDATVSDKSALECEELTDRTSLNVASILLAPYSLKGLSNGENSQHNVKIENNMKQIAQPMLNNPIFEKSSYPTGIF